MSVLEADLLGLEHVDAKPIADNLHWLEHETKINEVLSIAKEARAKSVLNSLAISTINDLTASMRSLKTEVETLKAEVAVLRENSKTRLSPEEKAELIADNLKWLESKSIKDIFDSTPQVTQIQREGFISDIRFASEMIANKVKTIHQGKNIMKFFIERFCIGWNCRILSISEFTATSSRFTINCWLPKGQIPWFLVKDYKIIYKVIYEINKRQLKRYIISPQGTYYILDALRNMDEVIDHYFRLVALKEGEVHEYDGVRHPRRSPPAPAELSALHNEDGKFEPLVRKPVTVIRRRM